MGTRGNFGVRVNRTDKLTYNHYDSYPSGLGKDIIEQLHDELKQPLVFKQRALDLRMVDEAKKPTKAQIEKLKHNADTNVGDNKITDWYCLLRKAQGQLTVSLDNGVMIEYASFMQDSLFCEWAYIANLDTEMLEMYAGFQHAPHSKGRYSNLGGEPTSGVASGADYYAVALIGEIPFDMIIASPKEAYLLMRAFQRQEIVDTGDEADYLKTFDADTQKAEAA